MATSIIDQLIGLTPDDLELIKVLSQMGAATAEEVALKLDRPGDDLTPQLHELVERDLMNALTVTVGDESYEVYQVDPVAEKGLLR